MSYSRHAMNENDLSMQHDVNYRVHMQVMDAIITNTEDNITCKIYFISKLDNFPVFYALFSINYKVTES